MFRFVLSDLAELASLGAFLGMIVMVAHAMGAGVPV
ncbi:MAG: hypothetical protein JWL62_357 [Hyphomicrobiales bacterium]|jgi:hypothetical protein|nr:hypothetical protein [Hyphomicrobiales bacterium]